METRCTRALTHQQRLVQIKAQLDEQARLNKVLRLGRVPRVVARILRTLDEARLGDAFTVLSWARRPCKKSR